MIKTGLTSVTFRNLNVDEIIDLAKGTGVLNIEWGGDLHVKDESDALYAYKACQKSGITCCSYGSYYRAGTYNNDYMSVFDKTLKTAVLMHCDTIRIWGYDKSTEQVKRSSEEYEKIVKELKDIAKIAKRYDISISFEHHQKTLTDDAKRAVDLIKDIDCENVKMYWQVQVPLTFEQNENALFLFKPYLKNLHISHQTPTGYLLLEDMQAQLKSYLEIVKEMDIIALIEFVKQADVNAYLKDIAVLKGIIENLNG